MSTLPNLSFYVELKRGEELVIRYILAFIILLASSNIRAECESSLSLHGALSIESCAPNSEGCLSAAAVLYDYSKLTKDDPQDLTLSLNASPWHFYDAEMRILEVEELADMIRPKLDHSINQVVLFASWTGVAPDAGGKSLAQKLSDRLNRIPVRGMDGFLWISKQGEVRTTHQAISTGILSRPYAVRRGDEVFASLVVGWPAFLTDRFLQEKNPDGIMLAAAGWEIFFLCPERALKLFETAAKLSNPIAAYNAAVMRLEIGKEDDVQIAKELLSQAARLGDDKAKARLQKLETKLGSP